ncbi:glutamate transport membrane-spanning protein [Klebsiella pneumoniae]|nr:glutamate transport membrane-spanning protein [Klebsiella pneumoniae]
MQFDWSAIWPAIPILLEGAKMTLWISVLGLAGGLIIGLVAGFAPLLRRLDRQPHRAGLY